jgi:16S rRNA processing protein RimM
MTVRDSNDSLDGKELVAVGRLAKTHGRHGEIAVDLLTDFPDRFSALERVFVEGDAVEAPRRVESVRFHKGRPLLKLEGVSGIGDAEALRGREIRVPVDELVPLPGGTFYHFQIRGLSVADRSRGEIGVVEDVLETGGTDVLVVRGRDGAETLVPLCEEIVTKIDPANGRIEIEAPEGLVSLNAN